MKTHPVLTALAAATVFAATSQATVLPVGIPNPAASFDNFDPLRSPKPDTRTHCPGWHEASPRANSRTSGDARDAYYIHNSHLSASDSANPFGNPQRPRKTVPNVAYTAGDYIEIHGDGKPTDLATPYTTALSPRGVGTGANPIWLVGVDQPVFTKTSGFGATNAPLLAHMVFDGIHWHGDSSLDIRPRFADNQIRNLTFRNCSMSGTGNVTNTTGIAVGASNLSIPSARTANIVFHKCEIRNFGDPAAPGEECGIYQMAFVKNLWILDCEIHHIAEDGIQGGHGMKRSSSGLYIGGCRIYDNVTNGIDLKQVGEPVVISSCHIFGHWANTANTTGVGENIVLHYSGKSAPGSEPEVWKNWPEDVTVIGCTIRDADYGIVASTSDRLRITGNFFQNIRHSLPTWNPGSAYSAGTAVHLRGIKDNFHISHNTIHACDNGIQIVDNPNAYVSTVKYFQGSVVSNVAKSQFFVCTDDNSGNGIIAIPPEDSGFWKPLGHQVWGNIIANRLEAQGRDLYVSSAGYGKGSIKIDFNFLYSPLGESISFGSSNILTLTQLMTIHQIMVNGRNIDPMFSNPGGSDFTLGRASPAVDFVNEGPQVDPYTDFETRFGMDIRRDCRGNARPFGLAWDAGAHENRKNLSKPGAPRVDILPP